MTITPYAGLRKWVASMVEETDEYDLLPQMAVEHFLQDDDFVRAVVSNIVRREVGIELRQYRVDEDAIREPKNRNPNLKKEVTLPERIPIIKPSENILVDMASMRRDQLREWAEKRAEAGQSANRDAAFLLAVAETLAPDEKVSDRYSIESLQGFYGNTTVQSEHRIFIKNNFKPNVRIPVIPERISR